MPYTDDPIADFDRHDAEQAKQLEKRPVCDHCENHIQDDHYFDINGFKLCPGCLEDYYKKDVDIE